MLNCASSVFYILSFSGPVTFMGRMMEVQFNKTSAGGSVFTGPLKCFGMAIGMLFSGFFITKYKPPPNFLFFWNVIVGLFAVLCTITYTQLGCQGSESFVVNGSIASCNSNCACDGISYSPVCDRSTGKTYFSPCHAGCKKYDEQQKIYKNCMCTVQSTEFELTSDIEVELNITSGECLGDCNFDYFAYSFLSMASHFISITGFLSSILLNFR